MAGPDGWWRRAVVYQVYIRSFADADGDGVGDIAGIRTRLAYLRELGRRRAVDHPLVPLADGRRRLRRGRLPGVDAAFGSLDGGRRARRRGARARAAGAHRPRAEPHLRAPTRGSPRRWPRAPRVAGPRPVSCSATAAGPDGVRAAQPLDRRRSGARRGSASPRPTAGRASGTSTCSRPEQPDLDWSTPTSAREFEDVLRTWFDARRRRVPDRRRATRWSRTSRPCDRPGDDAVALDVSGRARRPAHGPGGRPRRLPVVAGDRRRVRRRRGSCWARSTRRPAAPGALRPPRRAPRRVQLPFLAAGVGRRTACGRSSTSTLAALGAVGAAPTWVLSNHDETRHVTRYGRARTGIRRSDAPTTRRRRPSTWPSGPAGRARPRCSCSRLPGGAYVYQGEELGLPEVDDLPEGALRDPIWERIGHAAAGGTAAACRCPGRGPRRRSGSGRRGATPWLPQPASMGRAARSRPQAADPSSMLALYRSALAAARARTPGWPRRRSAGCPRRTGCSLFERDAGFVVGVNLSSTPVALPDGFDVLLRSDGPSSAGPLGADAAAWLAPR